MPVERETEVLMPLEARMDRLEEAFGRLADAQARTEVALTRLAEAQARTEAALQRGWRVIPTRSL